MKRFKKFINFIWLLMVTIGFQMPFYAAMDYLYKTKVDNIRPLIGSICIGSALLVIIHFSYRFRSYIKVFDT